MSHMTIGKRKILASTAFTHRGAKVMDSKGNLSASSNADALKIIASILEAQANGENIVTEDEAGDIETASMKRDRRQKVLAAIVADRHGATSVQTGIEMAGAIQTEVARIGIMRGILGYQPLEQGQRPEIEIRRPHLIAAIMTGLTQARLQRMRDTYVQVPEVSNTVRVMIENKRMNQSRNDLLQEAYDDGLTAIVVGEDRMWKRGTDALIDATGMGSTQLGTRVTPAMLEAGMTPLTGVGYGVEKIIIAAGLWTGITLSPDFGEIIEPITRLEIFRTGRVGQLFGAQLLTDAARSPNQKVLESNEVYFAAAPEFIGEYTDRGGVQSLPLTAAETGINGAGWHMNEELSVGIVGDGQSRIRLR